MLKFNLNVPERKTLAKRMEELTGIHPFYTRAPLYAYDIGDYTIDRDGNLLVDEAKADANLLRTLLEEGLITGGEVVGAQPSEEAQGEAEPEAAVDTTDESEPADNVTADDEPADADVDAAEEEPADEAEDALAETEPEDGDPIPDAEYEQEAEEEAAANEDEIDLAMNFDLPMGKHTGVSLRNLLNLIYTRGELIRKATGGAFRVDEGLIDALKDDSCTYSVTNFLHMVRDYEEQHGPALEGLTLTEDTVSFTGFPRAADIEHLTAYGHLAVLMNEQAITQKRIQAKGVDDTNERYAMRIWFLRLGMNGDQFKQTRKLLMENLSGHTAFRTSDQAERAKEKAAKKRSELKALQAEHSEAAPDPVQSEADA